jgi:hypothetical protein
MTMNASRPGHGLFLPVRRRQLLVAGIAGLVVVSLPRQVLARPSLEEAIQAFTGGFDVLDGRVRLDLPPLVENGNAVGITVTTESPMTEADHGASSGAASVSSISPARPAMTKTGASGLAAASFRRRIRPAIRSIGWSGSRSDRCSGVCATA